MRIIKKILGVVFFLVGGYITLFELAIVIGESYWRRDMGTAIYIFLFLSLGILLAVVGVKLILPKKQ